MGENDSESENQNRREVVQTVEYVGSERTDKQPDNQARRETSSFPIPPLIWKNSVGFVPLQLLQKKLQKFLG